MEPVTVGVTARVTQIVVTAADIHDLAANLSLKQDAELEVLVRKLVGKTEYQVGEVVSAHHHVVGGDLSVLVHVLITVVAFLLAGQDGNDGVAAGIEAVGSKEADGVVGQELAQGLTHLRAVLLAPAGHIQRLLSAHIEDHILIM